jgi:hypothetical protein
VGQLPTACAFANHFTAGISIVEVEETVDWVRFGRGLADPRLRAEIDVARDAGVARTCAPYRSDFSPPISFSALRQMIAAWHNVY